MNLYIVTNGIHTGTIFTLSMGRSIVLSSSTLKKHSFIADIPENERIEMAYEKIELNL